MLHVMIIKDRDLYVFWKSTCPVEETIMIKWENGETK